MHVGGATLAYLSCNNCLDENESGSSVILLTNFFSTIMLHDFLHIHSVSSWGAFTKLLPVVIILDHITELVQFLLALAWVAQWYDLFPVIFLPALILFC